MKRFLIVAVAALAAVLFTACPDKPADPVVIPDSTYEETAHFQFQRLGLDGDTTRILLNKDTILSTTVIISNGAFIYPDMCADTMIGSLGRPLIADHFIYAASRYCHGNRTPAEVSGDGMIVIKQPFFRGLTTASFDSSYVYRAPISIQGESYTFQQSHNLTDEFNIYEWVYHISHTLRPL